MTRHTFTLTAVRTTIVTAVILMAAGPAAAQPERLSNVTLRVHAVQTSLDSEFRSLAAATEPAWIAYAVRSVSTDASMCCSSGSGDCCVCRLEPGSDTSVNRRVGGTARLEAGDRLAVFYRVERGQVDRIRIFSDDCAIDAGGRTVHWLTGVSDTDSVAMIARFLDAERRVARQALVALAMHEDPVAIDRLIATARNGATGGLRGDALFWLGQRASAKAIGAISEAIERDPDTAVKRRAVFALSQLPAGEGIPRLIDVARAHSNPSVRKQAMFWLGQSRDPRALSFFAEILQP